MTTPKPERPEILNRSRAVHRMEADEPLMRMDLPATAKILGWHLENNTSKVLYVESPPFDTGAPMITWEFAQTVGEIPDDFPDYVGSIETPEPVTTPGGVSFTITHLYARRVGFEIDVPPVRPEPKGE